MDHWTINAKGSDIVIMILFIKIHASFSKGIGQGASATKSASALEAARHQNYYYYLRLLLIAFMRILCSIFSVSYHHVFSNIYIIYVLKCFQRSFTTIYCQCFILWRLVDPVYDHSIVYFFENLWFFRYKLMLFTLLIFGIAFSIF